MSFTIRETRALIRKAVKRVPEGEEIRHLNIMPMMDMMTILLVAFISQAAASATTMATGTVVLPSSVAEQELPEAATTLFITKTAIVVETEEIVAVRNGDVDASLKEGGADGRKIPRLSSFLGNLRVEHEKVLRKDGKPVPAVPELMIIADRSTPYGLLLSVMFSAKEKPAGYKRFRLIVQKSQVVTPAIP
ncbi:MAG TPA: biopolymer transporter ExbD [Kofleriaceae bacterium]|jgi:biopolymer transport protein ExbD|nr:biopolymer transporter ExbD [Kofleriaceae bacterium]